MASRIIVSMSSVRVRVLVSTTTSTRTVGVMLIALCVLEEAGRQDAKLHTSMEEEEEE